jgi:hypothetical protein
MDLRARWLENKLATAPQPVFVAYAMAAAFTTYFCMYASRDRIVTSIGGEYKRVQE